MVLRCNNNKLPSLPELNDNLEYLRCNNNKLTSLPELHNSLKHLYCDFNRLLSLPELPDSLKHLHCYNNKFTYLPELPDSLEYLYCNNNKLTSLPELPETLITLDCKNNELITLPELHQIGELCLFGNPIYYIVCNVTINENIHQDGEGEGLYLVENDINIINKNVKIITKFIFLYYSLKFKDKLRDWLWKKVREPKIKEQFHPSRIFELLKDKDIDDIDI
jgi:uncharacterized protein YdcH (DUF465 family)/uncharacterized protein with PQ loop repeat